MENHLGRGHTQTERGCDLPVGSIQATEVPKDARQTGTLLGSKFDLLARKLSQWERHAAVDEPQVVRTIQISHCVQNLPPRTCRSGVLRPVFLKIGHHLAECPHCVAEKPPVRENLFFHMLKKAQKLR